jgi:hypothetical protein
MYVNDHVMYIKGLLLALNGLDIIMRFSIFISFKFGFCFSFFGSCYIMQFDMENGGIRFLSYG